MSARPIQDLIIRHESQGSVKAQGVASPYDVVSVFIPAKHRPKEPLTTYPIKEVLEWQRFVVAKGADSSAAGAYQIILNTLAGLGLDTDRVFDIECQDDAAMVLLNRRGWDDCVAGEMTSLAFAEMLAREWASLPGSQYSARVNKRIVRRGESYYAGDGRTVQAQHRRRLWKQSPRR